MEFNENIFFLKNAYLLNYQFKMLKSFVCGKFNFVLFYDVERFLWDRSQIQFQICFSCDFLFCETSPWKI